VKRRLPLAGRRILVTRPRAQSGPLCTRLRALGARAIAAPTIRIVGPRAGGPLDRALRQLDRYDWVIVTSVNGVRATHARARALGIDLARARPRWAAVGPATARALRAAGVRAVVTPSRFLTAALGRQLRSVARRRVLLPRADVATPELARVLRARGARVDQVTAYRTLPAAAAAGARVRRLVAEGRVDTVLLTSASTVRGLVRLVGRGPALRRLAVACIGPVTAAAAVTAGLRPVVVATEHTIDGLIRALLQTNGTRGGRHGTHRAPS
jgi:uroporphyrinogen III methyltransferase/synthase